MIREKKTQLEKLKIREQRKQAAAEIRREAEECWAKSPYNVLLSRWEEIQKEIKCLQAEQSDLLITMRVFKRYSHLKDKKKDS